ncbi:MAG TPA: SpoIIE family protein phosphatase [Gemmataceae bacterium]|nr:SpoIIE family protein phosphatase [Gemmataceae bacterium]
MANLLILKGNNQGATVPLEAEKIVLGRNAECGVVINLPAVSREHAMIRRIQGKFYIEDLKSRNGTRVNNQDVTTRTLLKNNDRIKICDNEFLYVDRPPLDKIFPPDPTEGQEPDDEESSSTVEATLSQSSKQILETQPAEKLAWLLTVTAELTQTFDLKQLLPKIAESLFQVFKHGDRCFVIMGEEGSERLIPTVIKTRRAADESNARFSRRIVHKCLETAQALLSEDATSDKRFDLSQSIADCRIRSVMVAPLTSRSTGKAFGVIQIDTQDRHKKFTAEDLKLLLAVAGQASIALENARLHESVVARAGLERDLKLAHQVQLSFLPKKPPQLAGYEFYAHYEPAQEVGGDYYDFIPLPASRLAVMLGDVAGKGVPAALLMAKVSSDARFCMLTEPDPAQAVYKLNEQMQEAGMLDRFITLAAGLIDAAAHRVTFVNAGHLPPLVYRKATARVEEATSRDMAGFPLGVADGIPYEAATVVLQPGDVVVIFTDGVTEAKNKQDAEFQMEGAYSALLAGTPTAMAMGERLVAAVKQHALGCKQHDDITVVCFGRT